MTIQNGRRWLRLGRKRRRCGFAHQNTTKFQEESEMKKRIALRLTAAMNISAAVSVNANATVEENQ